MAFCFHPGCPACQKVHPIYVNEAEIPAMADCFRYECPEKHQQVAVRPGAVVIDVAIPAGSIIAQRIHQ